MQVSRDGMRLCVTDTPFTDMGCSAGAAEYKSSISNHPSSQTEGPLTTTTEHHQHCHNKTTRTYKNVLLDEKEESHRDIRILTSTNQRTNPQASMSTDIEAMNEMCGDLSTAFGITIGVLVGFAISFIACPHMRWGNGPSPPKCIPNTTTTTPKTPLDPSQVLHDFVDNITTLQMVLGGVVVVFIGYKVMSSPGGKLKGLGDVFLLVVWGFVGVVGAFSEVCYAVARGFGFEVGRD
jgi:hypothetical protein